MIRKLKRLIKSKRPAVKKHFSYVHLPLLEIILRIFIVIYGLLAA